MKTFLILMLIVLGLFSALAIFAPGAVEIGFYMLVLPGLILMLAPTAFISFAIFTLVWWATSRGKGGTIAVLAGLAAVAAFATIPPLLDGYRTKQALAAVQRAPIMPQGPVTLAGDIWLKLPSDSQYAQENGCSGLCMDLLDRPGVTAVTEELTKPGGPSKTNRYRLLTSEAACQKAKTDPTKVIMTPINMTAYVAEGDNDTVYHSRKALFESGTACLLREAVVLTPRDHTIDFDDSPTPIPNINWSLSTVGPIGKEMVTISDKTGKVQFFSGSWMKWSLALPLRTTYSRNNNQAAVGWDISHQRVGQTELSAQSMLYIAIIGKPPQLAVDRYPTTPAPAPIPIQP